jgi:4-amino-4-deoxy-L-arabinose transferase-like glycosyltransferase
MAGLQLLGVDKLDSARLIAVVSFVVLISVVAMMLRREAGSNIPAFVTSAILVTSPVMLNLYAWVMSEALYLALAFMALYLLWNSENQRRTLLVLAAAILCGLALLTRYVGIALAATGLVLIVLAKTSARRKLAEASLLLGIGALPMLGWIVRNAQLTGNLANRNVLWHPVGLEHLEQLALHVLDWFVPAQILARRLPLTGLIPLLGLIVGVVLLVLWRAAGLSGRFRREGLPTLLALHISLYLAALAISLTLFDPSTQVDDRILSPVYVATMIVAGLGVWEVLRGKAALPRFAVLAGLASFLLANGLVQSRRVASYGLYGLGNAAPTIGNSETVAAVKELPSVPIATNGMARLYFWADRYTYSIPWRIDLDTGAERTAYQADLQQLRDRLCPKGGVLVLFEPENLLPEQASLTDLTQGLSLFGQYQDGEIYFCDDPGTGS